MIYRTLVGVTFAAPTSDPDRWTALDSYLIEPGLLVWQILPADHEFGPNEQIGVLVKGGELDGYFAALPSSALEGPLSPLELLALEA